MKAQVILTPSESKRLIGKGVASMDVVKEALKSGLIVIASGVTNSYVAEEILGKPLEKTRFASGIIVPEQWTAIPARDRINWIIIEKGMVREDLTFSKAIGLLRGKDVFIKGANALDITGMAGIYLGDPDAGSLGKFLGQVMARGVNFVIPVGLEKLTPTPIKDIAAQIGLEKVELAMGWSGVGMMPVVGKVITEIQALKILTGVEAIDMGGGGVGGAEGARVFLLKGNEKEVRKAFSLAQSIKGEPAFVPISTGWP